MCQKQQRKSTQFVYSAHLTTFTEKLKKHLDKNNILIIKYIRNREK